ncbi:MAG: DNA polymerase III subunit alpha [Bacteroidia bacterium]|nr:DNA polymerase III subunit alpha [Bacteroidia bacterium]
MHLHLHSNYSFLAGTLSIERILAHGKEQGCSALALTDTNNVSGVMEFYTSCLRQGIKPIPGAEFRLGGQRAVVLARSWDGYERLCAALTSLVAIAPPARILESAEDVAPPDADDTDPGQRDSDTLATILARHLDASTIVLSSHVALLRSLRGSCDAALYVELIKAHEARWPTLLDGAKELAVPLVATNDVYFGAPAGRELHRALRAIATNTTLGTLSEDELAPPECWFIGHEEFRQWFRHVPQALRAREEIIASVDVRFDTESSKFTRYPDLPDAQKAMRLRSLAEDGLRFRYSSDTAEAQRRMEKELDIIRALGFVDYFLVAWDLIRFARFRGYPYVGRGSGANSIVAYCLQITNVDPIELDLFFERFLNPERKSPPDFDIDFSWRNRDDVIAYALSKYGSERTAMICTISTFNPRGALREIGKALGFSAAEIKQVTAMLPGYGSAHDFNDENSPFRKHMGPVLNSPYGKEWARYAKALLDFPNHYGIHSGGVILAPEVMTRYTATQIAPKGVRITQQDMYSLEDWRLEKLDILSIRGLGTFEDTMFEVKRRSGVLPPIQDYKIACRDTKTREIMRKGETVGCFYVESPAMIQLLKKLRTDTFEMLTAASSIIRPGVAQSGMMQAFIERYHDRSKIDPPHPAMAELLKSTYGVMVYQEDVIKVAHFIGKLSLGEADLLRRAMSGKMRSREAMRALKHTFFIGCARQGIGEDVSAEIWRQMESFAGYSFCKAHSASYAVLSFQEAWLKAHYPALFLCAVLNNQGGYYRPEVYIQEARRLGLAILLPDVNASDQLHTCPNDRTIQLGFLHIKGLTERTQEALLRERRENGRYVSFEDFLERSGATFDDVSTLVRCGACDTLEQKRGAMLVKTKLFFNRQGSTSATQSLQLGLPGFDAELRRLKDYSPEQIAQIELETFTYTVSTHILSHFKEQLRDTITATELERHVGRRVSVGGWMIAAKLSRTKKGERMMFINLDDSTGRIDVVLFPKCFDAHAHLLRTAGPFIITGVVKKEYGVVSLIGEKVALLTQK